MIYLAGLIKAMIDAIIQERSNGNPVIAEMTKAKFILKGINPDKYRSSSADDPVIIQKLHVFAQQLNSNREKETGNILTVTSAATNEKDAVADIKNQLNDFSAKLIIFFASSSYNHSRLSFLLQEAYKDCTVCGCSTAGEIISGELLRDSVVVMALNSKISSDAKAEVIENLQTKLSVERAFASFERYYHESAYTMDTGRYVGIVLIDGLSMKEEDLMDQIGNRTNVCFIGGAAGDDHKFLETFVCANGQAYSDAAVLLLVKMNENAEFGFIKTQSFKALDHVLVANKVNKESREVIEFNNKPAIEAYAEVVGAASVEDAPRFFGTNPVGLLIGNDDFFIRSPRQKIGTKIKFYCNLLEGMEVRLLEATNIIEDTTNALNDKIAELGRIEGLINFHCIERTTELEKKNLVEEYGQIFKDIPTIGFSTYGEELIGHMNQTSTMLVFKSGRRKSYADYDFTGGEKCPNHRDIELIIQKLITENNDLCKIILEKNRQLEETTTALKDFNIMLDEEITERTKREEEISYLSYHDKLTGLYNRRFYEEEIKRLDTTRNLPISIIMGDVNDLKVINDTFGHAKGDELLVKAAAAIQSACRTDDIAARWGGDEFVILLPNTQNEDVQSIINRINGKLRKEYVCNVEVSVSFGYATKNKPNDDILEVLKRAEDYMYEQKIIQNQLIRGSVIERINHTLHERSHREEQHSQRVGELCQKIGRAIGMTELEVGKLKAVGVLHDIGKIVIEDYVLDKKEKLSEQEWNQIKRHPDVGYRIIRSYFDMAELADAILSHHERWDGKGYPRGLKGQAIPVTARIIALADSYDAMISERPYRKALSKQEALKEIERNLGQQFDPEIARVFIDQVLNEE